MYSYTVYKSCIATDFTYNYQFELSAFLPDNKSEPHELLSVHFHCKLYMWLHFQVKNILQAEQSDAMFPEVSNSWIII